MIIECSLCDGEGEGEILKGVLARGRLGETTFFYLQFYRSTSTTRNTPKFRPPHKSF